MADHTRRASLERTILPMEVFVVERLDGPSDN